MTDPAAPTTEAGRALIERTWLGAGTLNLLLRERGITDIDLRDWRPEREEVAAIEAEARSTPAETLDEHEAALKSWLMDIGRRYNESVSDPHMWIEGIKAEVRQQVTDDMTTAYMVGFEKGREAHSTPAEHTDYAGRTCTTGLLHAHNEDPDD